MTIKDHGIVDLNGKLDFIRYISRKHTHSAYIYYDNIMIDSIIIFDNDIDILNEYKFLNDMKNSLSNEQKLLLTVEIKCKL